MKKLFLLFLGLALISGYALAEELEYFRVHTPKAGMTADEIMQVEYFVKYTKFCRDVKMLGKAYYIDRSGFVREKETARMRITLGRKSDDLSYKDIVMFTSPQVIGLSALTWTYMNPQRQNDSWLWVPSLRKIRKISASNNDDAFMGSDFSVEDITTRRFEDETYTLLREEDFKGYACEFDKQTYYKDTPSYVIECKPKKSPWYYSKRVLWVDKNTGGGFYEEKYDPNGKIFMTIFKKFEILKVNDKDYTTQVLLEGKDLRTGHRTVIVNDNFKFDQGLSEELFTERALMQTRW